MSFADIVATCNMPCPIFRYVVAIVRRRYYLFIMMPLFRLPPYCSRHIISPYATMPAFACLIFTRFAAHKDAYVDIHLLPWAACRCLWFSAFCHICCLMPIYRFSMSPTPRRVLPCLMPDVADVVCCRYGDMIWAISPMLMFAMARAFIRYFICARAWWYFAAGARYLKMQMRARASQRKEAHRTVHFYQRRSVIAYWYGVIRMPVWFICFTMSKRAYVCSICFIFSLLILLIAHAWYFLLFIIFLIACYMLIFLPPHAWYAFLFAWLHAHFTYYCLRYCFP